MDSIDLSIKEKRSKYFIPLLIGAIWNIFFGSLCFFNLQLSNSLFFSSITPEAKIIANKTWWFVVIMAGIGYGIVAFANHKFRFFVTIGAIGKMAFFFFVIYLWLGSIATDFAATVVFGDFVWAIYFFFFIFRTREYGYL